MLIYVNPKVTTIHVVPQNFWCRHFGGGTLQIKREQSVKLGHKVSTGYNNASNRKAPNITNEPCYGRAGVLHMRKQGRGSASW